MKTTAFSLVLAVSSLTGLIAAADSTAAANVTLTTGAAANSSSKIGIQGWRECTPQSNGLRSWYFASRGEGPYECTRNHDRIEWSMLNAYRSGGTLGVHWKYTDDVNDGECLKDWKFYTADGQTWIASISGRTTTVNDPRRWCALPVYRPGGVQGKQWEICQCLWVTS